jgi:hypothetical protein
VNNIIFVIIQSENKDKFGEIMAAKRESETFVYLLRTRTGVMVSISCFGRVAVILITLLGGRVIHFCFIASQTTTLLACSFQLFYTLICAIFQDIYVEII